MRADASSAGGAQAQPATRSIALGNFASLPTAAGGITRLAAARLGAAGVDPAPLLERAGLSLAQVGDHTARLGVAGQIRFLNLADRALRDPFLGFNLAKTFDLREIGLLYYVTASAETLGEGLMRAARYTSITNEAIYVRCQSRHEFSVEISYLGVGRHTDRHQIEFCMTAILRQCRTLTNRTIVPRRVSFVHQLARDSREMTRYFGCTPEFGASADEIVFDLTVRALAHAEPDPHLSELLTRYGEEALAKRLRNASPLRVSVENVITPLLPHGKARLDEIARKLGMSNRTLARRLAAEGYGFAEILDAQRSDLASQYLSEPSLPISKIAWLLGYQEVSAFSHACKRWTGKMPKAIRAQAAAQ